MTEMLNRTAGRKTDQGHDREGMAANRAIEALGPGSPKSGLAGFRSSCMSRSGSAT